MPNNAPQFKKDAVRKAGGLIIECEPNLVARIEAVNREVGRRGSVEIHPPIRPTSSWAKGLPPGNFWRTAQRAASSWTGWECLWVVADF